MNNNRVRKKERKPMTTNSISNIITDLEPTPTIPTELITITFCFKPTSPKAIYRNIPHSTNLSFSLTTESFFSSLEDLKLTKTITPKHVLYLVTAGIGCDQIKILNYVVKTELLTEEEIRGYSYV